jgi:hypothetical protein
MRASQEPQLLPFRSVEGGTQEAERDRERPDQLESLRAQQEPQLLSPFRAVDRTEAEEERGADVLKQGESKSHYYYKQVERGHGNKIYLCVTFLNLTYNERSYSCF